MVSDLNKKFGGSTDLAEKKAWIGGFAYPYSPPSSSVENQESRSKGSNSSSNLSAKQKSAKKTKQASGNSNFSGKGVSENNPTCENAFSRE